MNRFLAVVLMVSTLLSACGGDNALPNADVTATLEHQSPTLEPSRTPNPEQTSTLEASTTPTSPSTSTEEPAPSPTPDTRTVVVLTIDDGWIKGAFDMMLDSLSEYDVQATFFLIATAADQLGAARMRRLVTDGHEIAYHSYRHGVLEDLEKWGSVEWSEDYDHWAESMLSLLGEEQFNQAVRPYARAPYGLFNAGFLAMTEQKGLVPVSWSADAEMLARGVPLMNGDILMLHVSTSDSLTLADILLRQDLRLGPLSELLPPDPPGGVIRDIPS